MGNNNYLYLAIRAAIDAGKAIMDIYMDPAADFGIEQKADHSPLTRADKAAHAVITALLSVTPFPILSEEGADIPYKERKKWRTFWLVDPLDGTKEFIKRTRPPPPHPPPLPAALPPPRAIYVPDPLDGTKEFIKRNGEFTVNIALIEDGVPTAGVIYVPVRKELYFGSLDKGAFKASDIDYNHQPTFEVLHSTAKRLPANQLHQGVVVVASRSHMTEETRLYVDNLRKQGMPVTMISSGSSLKICLVAEGSADIYPRFAPTMEWDTAAGHAIAKAAGCEVYHIDEKTPLRYNKEDLHNPWFIVK